MFRSDHTPCCSTVITTGLSNTFLLGNYNFNGTLINGRPLYVGESETYAIWFDGDSGSAAGWMIGTLSDLKIGNHYGFGLINQDTKCPTLTGVLKEWINNNWETNENGRLECVPGT